MPLTEYHRGQKSALDALEKIYWKTVGFFQENECLDEENAEILAVESILTDAESVARELEVPAEEIRRFFSEH
jgi:hypothetical protein